MGRTGDGHVRFSAYVNSDGGRPFVQPKVRHHSVSDVVVEVGCHATSVQERAGVWQPPHLRSREDEVVAHQVRISRQADGVVSSVCVVVDGLGVESPSFPLDEQTQMFLASVFGEEPALRGRLYVKSLELGVGGQLNQLALSLVETIREEEFWRDDGGRDWRRVQTWGDETG